MNGEITITNLYRCRYEKGLSQSALSQLSGVSIHTIHSFERGGGNKIECAKLNTLVRLAETLDVPIYRLLDDTELARRLQQVEFNGLKGVIK